MFSIKNFEPRSYQKSIFESSKNRNTLVVLPTGLGKTALALLSAIHQLNQYPNSKILLCSPTKPLCAQHVKSFKHYTDIENVSLLTGEIPPETRKNIWDSSSVIVATPQTIQSDLENSRISLKDVSLLVIDEAHRSRMKFANTLLAKNYNETSDYKRVLALTASPGGNKEKIKEICENLFIENVEIRTESDEEVMPYVQDKKIEWINVVLPEEYIKIVKLLKQDYKERLERLRSYGFTKPVAVINRRDLLQLQARFQKEISQKNFAAFQKISVVAQAIKIDYAIELLETQSVNAIRRYMEKLRQDKSKAAKIIVNSKNFLEVAKLLENLNAEHPKMQKLKEIVSSSLSLNPNSRLIIFANFRDTVKEIVSALKVIPEAKPTVLTGKKEGMTQKQQVNIVKLFSEGVFNILCCTSIGEEGLDIPQADTAIFYDHGSGSEIRKVQRAGRVARLKPGNILYLIAKNTRDEAYYWSAKRKEKIMRSTLHKMQNKFEEQATLLEDV